MNNNFEILNIKEPILLNNLLSPNDNLHMLNYLVNNQVFYIQEESDGLRFRHAFENSFPHSGFCSEILRKEETFNPNLSVLHTYVYVIVNNIINNLKFKYKNIERIHFNYYLTGQSGQIHKDDNRDNFVSILYNPHTTDGGTEILGKTHLDQMGQAKLFKSNWDHKAIGTKKDKARSSLNIVLELY